MDVTPIGIERLILHPGSPKTGTSGLQNFLHRHREALSDLGYLYPQAGLSGNPGLARGHHDLAYGLGSADPGQIKRLEAAATALRAEIAAAPDKVVILSSEEFFGAARIAPLCALLAPRECDIYVSLRAQHELFHANYYTAVTHRRIAYAPEKMFDWLCESLRYGRMLEGLSEICPGARLHLRLFEKGSPARISPVADFLQVLGIPLQAGKDDNPVEHPTLPAAPTLFLRWLNEIGLEQIDFFRIFEALHRMRAAGEPGWGPHSTLSPQRTAEVAAFFDAENREIRRRFLDGADAPLFRPPVHDDEQDWQREIGAGQARVAEEMLVRLVRRADARGGDTAIAVGDGADNCRKAPEKSGVDAGGAPRRGGPEHMPSGACEAT